MTVWHPSQSIYCSLKSTFLIGEDSSAYICQISIEIVCCKLKKDPIYHADIKSASFIFWALPFTPRIAGP